MARLEVHSAALAGVAAQLDAAAAALAGAAASPLAHPPFAADEVSASAAARLSAHGQLLSSRARDGAAVLASAADAVRQSLGAYTQTDLSNAAGVALRGGSAAARPAFTASAAANAPTPLVPIAPVAPRDGKSIAALIEAGNASAGAGFVAGCHTMAGVFRGAATTVQDAQSAVQGALTGQGGTKLAGALGRFGEWAQTMAQHSDAIGNAGRNHRDRFTRTQHSTPRTHEFTNTERQLAAAQALNTQPGTAGRYTAAVNHYQTELAGLHGKANVSMTGYQLGELPAAPPGPPPVTPVVSPGGSASGQPAPPGDNLGDQPGAQGKPANTPVGESIGEDPLLGDEALDDDHVPGPVPAQAGSQPLAAMMSLIPGLLGAGIGAATAIPAALAQQGQQLISQGMEAVSGLTSDMTKPDLDTGEGGSDIGGFAGSSGAGSGGGAGGGQTQPAAGAGRLSPSTGTGIMSVAGPPTPPPVAGPIAGSAAPPDAGGMGGAPMMMPPMAGMGGGAGAGGGARQPRPADKEVHLAQIPNGEPVRGEVVRRSARASIADPPRPTPSAIEDDVVVTSARTGKRVILDEDNQHD
ncbi:hypothetical protein AWC17_25135 [Mycobacterium nebraskense]|uniref:PE domain-containing protein n=1 Tax=Mycobacterium nebraskense TaxID=244292 RepID=A0A1X1ZZG5_9MYCO|nr:PE domain-containing protein [Mycobacterium nebraskense]ORW32694.1 hypothetical protein AWC17_25135 [Mycobacterium nebraskense]